LNKTTQLVIGKFPTKANISMTISNSVCIPMFYIRIVSHFPCCMCLSHRRI
jgi:hypothetical protein